MALTNITINQRSISFTEGNWLGGTSKSETDKQEYVFSSYFNSNPMYQDEEPTPADIDIDAFTITGSSNGSGTVTVSYKVSIIKQDGTENIIANESRGLNGASFSVDIPEITCNPYKDKKLVIELYYNTNKKLSKNKNVSISHNSFNIKYTPSVGFLFSSGRYILSRDEMEGISIGQDWEEDFSEVEDVRTAGGSTLSHLSFQRYNETTNKILVHHLPIYADNDYTLLDVLPSPKNNISDYMKLFDDEEDESLGWIYSYGTSPQYFLKENNYVTSYYTYYAISTNENHCQIKCSPQIQLNTSKYYVVELYIKRIRRVNFINTLNYNSNNLYIDIPRFQNFQKVKDNSSMGTFIQKADGYWHSNFTSPSSNPKINTVFSFELQAEANVKFFQKQNSSSSYYTYGEIRNIFPENDMYYDTNVNSNFYSTSSTKRNTVIHSIYSNSTTSLTLPKGKYYFVAHFQGHNNLSTSTNNSSFYFAFKIEINSEANTQILNPQYVKQFRFDFNNDSETLNFNLQRDCPEMILSNNKYTHRGWIYSSGVNDPSNPGEQIKGPNAIVESNTNYGGRRFPPSGTFNFDFNATLGLIVNFYSLEQSKYVPRFYNYPHTSIHKTNTSPVFVGSNIYMDNTTTESPIERTGFAFKGWTILNNTTNTTYDKDRDSSSYYYRPNNNYSLTLAMINNGTIDEDDDYFYLNFYPVWNLKYNIIYNDTLHNKIITAEYVVEKDASYTIKSNDYTSNTFAVNPQSDEGYNFVGWTLRNKDNNNNDRILYGPKVTNSAIYFSLNDVTSSNFENRKSSLYKLIDSSYVLVDSDEAYNASETYYERISTYNNNNNIGTITENTTLYALWQRKYTIKFSSTGTNSYNETQTGIVYDKSPNIIKPTNNPSKTGYVFKGWTYYKDSNCRDYGYQFQFNSQGFYSNLNTRINDNMLDTSISNITSTYNASTGKGVFYLWFYAVWNKAYNINFIIDYGSVDSNNKIIKTNSYIAEQGVGFSISSSHLPSLPSNIGYSLQGWTEREPFDSDRNPDLNIIGPNATRNLSIQYIEASLNETEFNSKKMSLYIYDTDTSSYTLLVPDGINPSTISYDSSQTYYEAFVDLSATGSSINKRKIYKDLTYYAVLKKQYTVIFKNAYGSTFEERSPQNINTTVSKPSTNPTLTYTLPNISYSDSETNNYGFVQDSDGVWTSQNGGHKQSYALGTFRFTAPASCCVMIEAECTPTNSYDTDIGYFSKLNNTNFSANYNIETSTNYYVTSQYKNAGKFYVIYEIPSSGTYSFQVKYRRGTTSDSSSSQDKLAFKINFINLNRSFQGWTLDKTDHSYETKLDDTDFYANNKSLPYVNDNNAEPANLEDPLVGPFTITYYPVFSKLYYLAFSVAPVQNSYWYPIQIYYNIVYKANQSYNSSTWPIGSYLTNGFNILSWTPTEHFGDQTETYSGYSTSSGTVSNITSNLTLYANQQRKYKGYFFKFFSDDTAYSVNSAYTLLNKSPTKPSSNPIVNNAIFKAWTLEKSLGYYYGLDSTNLTKVFTTIPNITSSTPYVRLSDGTFAIYYYGVWNPKYSITVIDELNSTATHKEFCVEHGKNYALNNFTAPTSTNGYNMIGLRKINHYETPDVQNLSFTGDHFNFGFKPSEGEKNTWESTNQGQKNSYSYGKFYIQLNSPGTIEITAQNNSEKNCDYGIFSQLDQDLSFGQTVDGSTKVLKTGKGIDTQYTCSYSIEDTNEHYITVKYIKDSSVNTADDKLKFSISLIDDKEVIGPTIVKEADDYLFSNTINNITENLILSVLWKKKYQVIFKKADGTNYSAVQNKLINDTITTPKNTDVTRTNYNLKGWTLRTEAKYQDYLTRDETNFYLPNTSVTIGDYVLEQDEDGYFNIIYYPVWIRTYKVTFKNSITNESKINIVEKKDSLDITTSKALTLSTTDKGYDYLGWTARNPSTTENVVGPTAEKLEEDYNLPNNTNPQTISNITSNITLWAIAKKKYTLRFYKDNGTYVDKPYYYINSNGPSGITDAKTNYNFKGWTLDSSKRSYDSNEPIYASNKVPIRDEDSEPMAENGAFYIYYYSVFNDLYTVSYYEYKNDNWELKKTDVAEKGAIYNIQNITGIFSKTEYELIGWNNSDIFPNTTIPTYNLYNADSNTSFTINNNISLYTAWRRRYAVQLESDDSTSLSTIISSFPSSQGTSGNIRYYNRNQILTITLTAKDDFHHCFKTYDYDEGENNDKIITVGAQNKTLTYTINLDPNVYDDNTIHKIHYSLGKAIKVTPIFNILSLKNKDNDYYNNSFYLNTNSLNNSGNAFVERNNSLEKEFTSEYYYPGDTISLVFSHQIPQVPLYEYYINKIDFYKEGTYSSRKTLTESKDRIQLSEAISDNFTKYTYTYEVKLEDIQSTEKGIYIISYYIPYNNIIHIGNSFTNYIDLSLPQDSNQYTFHMWTGTITRYRDGYIYVFNDQSENCYVTITPYNVNGFIPTSFTYKDPSMNSNETVSIYNFLDQENPGSNWKNFYYNNKYTLNTIGIKLTPEDTSTYHEGLYELKMTGSTGYLQKVDIISKPISKLEITKAAETILEKTEENHLTFYINSSLLEGNNTSYLVQDQKDSGLSFKEFKLDTADTYSIITKSDIIDNNISLPSGWTRTESKDHTDIITYTNNNLSARNGYIDYVTITFDESLPLFYVDQKALQLYWENTKAEGLYWENIRLL